MRRLLHKGGTRLIVLLLFSIATAACAQESSTDDTALRFFRIGTGTAAGTYFPIGAIIANAISNPPGSPDCTRGGSCGVPGLIAVAVTTQGSGQNVADLLAGNLEAAIIQADVAFWAAAGAGPFAERGPVHELAAIGRLHTEHLHLVASLESGVTDVQDLVGRRVSLGVENSGSLAVARQVLAASGIAEESIEAVHLSPEEAADQMTDGTLDAFFLVAGAPTLVVSDLIAREEARLVEISGPGIIRMLYDQPFLAGATIAAGVYPQTGRVQTIGMGALLVVPAALDDATAYGIARALWHPTTAELLVNGHLRGGDIRLSDARRGVPLPIHDGAQAYYRVIGLTGPSEPRLNPAFAPPSIGAAMALIQEQG